MRAWVVQAAMPLVAVAFLLMTVVTLGRLATEDLRTRERFLAAFAEIRCEPPAPMRRQEFLREVQYEADWSDHFDRSDPGLTLSLRSAFLHHPWVEEVERVEVPASGPVSIRLRYRMPALAVAGPGKRRVLDRNG